MLLAAGREVVSKTSAYNITKLSYRVEVRVSREQNKKRISTGRRYPEEVKRFALTGHFYSPKAYKYLRTVFSLPHGSSLNTIGHLPYNVILFF